MGKRVITGKYSTATVFADIVEEEALSQIGEVCNQEFTEGSTIAVMPDVHGIYTTSVCTETIDESPFAYKGIKDILPMLEDTAEVVKHIKSIYNFKASDVRY